MAINVGLRLPVPLPLSPKFSDEPAAGMNPRKAPVVSAYPRIRTQFNLTVILMSITFPWSWACAIVLPFWILVSCSLWAGQLKSEPTQL